MKRSNLKLLKELTKEMDDSKGLDGTLSGQLMTQKTQNTPGIYFVFFIHDKLLPQALVHYNITISEVDQRSLKRHPDQSKHRGKHESQNEAVIRENSYSLQVEVREET